MHVTVEIPHQGSSGLDAAIAKQFADIQRQLMEKLCLKLLDDLEDDDRRSHAVMECVRKLLSDNSVTIASVRKGDFGELAQKAAEQFPFDDQGRPLGGETTSGVN